MGDIKVELGKVDLNLLTVSNERSQLVTVETAPLKEGGRTLVDDIHSAGINGDVSRAERSDGYDRSIESDEMHIDLTVFFGSSGDRQAGGEGTSEGVNEDVYILALVLDDGGVNGGTVEVIASEVALERDVVCVFCLVVTI